MRNALLAWGLVWVSPCVATAQIAILHLRVTEGEAAVHRAGSRAAHPLTVEVTDETGRPQPGVAVSFRLPDDGPGGVFANGLRTELILTGDTGRASLHGLQLNHIAGPFRIRITAAKEQVRAGIVSLQYVADSKAPPGRTAVADGDRTRSAPPVKTVQRGGRKWLVMALVAAGAVAGGIGAKAASGKSAASTSPAAAPAQVSVGVPAISLGKP